MNMEKHAISVLVIFIILLSSASASVIIKPSLAGLAGGGLIDNTGKGSNDLSSLSNGSGCGKSKIPNSSQPVLDNQSLPQSSTLSAWDFANTSEWSSFAYSKGGMTRLIIGITRAGFDEIALISNLVAKYGARLVDSILIDQNEKALVVELPLSMTAVFTGDLRTLNFIKYVEPDMQVQTQFIPNDPYWSLQWGLQKVQADWAWNTTSGNRSILVAIVDTGIDYNHPDLRANYVPLGYNWVDNDSDPLDDYGHGTHVAGIIAAAINNNIGIAGLAQVRIMAEKSFDSSGFGYDDWIANGIIHATQRGAKIISMSFGSSEDSQLIHDAIKAAFNNGTLLVAAAGNSNSDIKSYPAAYDEVISVAATDQNDNKASFSNWGSWVELAAPGVNIFSTMPTYHVTLNDDGIAMNYDFLSGTSMACPLVSGVAALVWSLYPNKTRDWIRLWLRYTADDIGVPSLDEFGRIDARKAIAESPPTHDLIAYSWSTPPIIEPGTLATINATILNFGGSDETNVAVNLLANGTIVNSTSLGFLAKGNSTQTRLYWKPVIQGTYNLTLYVNPVVGETNAKNNVLSKFIFVGVFVKAVVLRSAGNVMDNIVTNWQTLNDQWHLFGKKAVYIDYSTLNIQDITYSDIVSTGADVLIISGAYNSSIGWEFSNSEIEAIKEYVHEGHGLVATAGTFSAGTPSNSKLASLFGISGNVSWATTESDFMNLINSSSPFLSNIPNPFIFPSCGTAVPSSGQWNTNVLEGGTYLALGNSSESAIVTFRGLIYISSWLEIMPAYYHYPLQLLYNAITVSKYQPPPHDLEVSLECSQYVKPSENTLINATITNIGLNDETNVILQLLINGILATFTVTNLTASASKFLQYLWMPTKGVYNVTTYAPPVRNETYIVNNRMVELVKVTEPLFDPIEGQYANYELSVNNPNSNFTEELDFQYLHYLSPYQINITMFVKVTPENVTMNAWIVVNTFTRIIERDSGINWTGTSYLGWLETNVTIGSQVSILDTKGTVIGSETVFADGRFINCWKISVNDYGFMYDFWYDKTSGLWIAMQNSESSGNLSLKSTNIPIGYAHDVSITLSVPPLIPPGHRVTLNATAYNNGWNTETNVTMQIIINGTLKESKNIPSLTIEESYTMNYDWTPPIQGKYNFTAYVIPMSNENYTANNIFTKFVRVSQVKGHVLFDQTHGTDNITLYNNWVGNLTDEGYMVETLNGAITQVTLEKYDVFVILQASIPYDLNETYFLRNFVLNGGSLLVVGGNSTFVTSQLTSFAGVNWLSNTTSGGVANDITKHPITDGVTSVFFPWGPTSILSVALPATSIIRDYLGNTLLAVSEVGLGKIIAVSTLGSFTDPNISYDDNLRLALNMIEWLAWKDTTPPSINIISPLNGIITKNTSLLVQWIGTDNDTRINYYSVYMNNSLVANVTSTNYTFSKLTQGIYNATVVAYDMGMNGASSYIIVTVDLIPPTISLISPVNDSYVGGLVSVNMTGYDDHFGFMTLHIDGSLIATYNRTGAYAYAWNTTGLEGQHVILLDGIDQAGNTAQTQIQVTVDNTMPIGEIMEPLNATYVRGLISIQLYSYDQNLKSTKVFVDQNLLYDWGNDTNIHRLSWDTTTVAEGIHTIKLSVVDKAGNTLEKTVTIIVDNTNPQVSINAPANASSVNGILDISFSATDDNEGTLLLYIDNAVYNVTGQATYSWNSQQVSDGSHVIKVVATDKAGNIGQAQVAVITTNIQTNYISRITGLLQNITNIEANYNANITKLQQRINSLEQMYVVAGVIVAAAFILTFAYITSRKRPSVTKQV